MTIINLTQHPATAEQVAAGVVDLNGVLLATLKTWLTFDTLPDTADIYYRAAAIAELVAPCVDGAYARYADLAMIGGAPYLTAQLERELLARGVQPVYAFSVRESVEEPQPDGSVRKVNVFRHAGFVYGG